MKRISLFALGLLCLALAPARAQQPVPAPAPPQSLLSPQAGADGAPDHIKPSSAQVSVSRSAEAATPGLVISIQPGADGYPGIRVEPPGGAWDLSAHGRVEARVTNLSDEKFPLNLRLDNAGDWKDNPTNAEVIYLGAKETATVTVRFGQNYGHPGYALKAKAVTAMMIFTGKATKPRSLRIDSVQATGVPGEKPPVKPEDVRIKPKGGILFGANLPFDAAKQATAVSGAAVQASPAGLALTFAPKRAGQAVKIKPPEGRWDLREAWQVRVKLLNSGTQPVQPAVRLESSQGPGELMRMPEPLAPGTRKEMVVPFAAIVPAQNFLKEGGTFGEIKSGTGTRFASDAVSAIVISTDETADERAVTVEGILAEVPPPATLPAWLGKRPPVPGEWTMTFQEEFEGPAIDAQKWNIASANYWDPKSHFSRDNVSVAGGKATLRFEKKRGFHNDDPKGKETDYATGYLDTFNHFRQRYGYFEARVKVPEAPGMWPAFWLMPDRGPGRGDRTSTGKGGMEFDIWEPLTRWGRYRYNIAMHFDGYGKEHKQVGSPFNYALPDAEGFITVGMLWSPGSAIYYANGQEVLRYETPRIAEVPGYIIFTAVSGGWDNDQIDDSKLPATTVIDYTRVWQRADLAALPESPDK